MRSQILMRGAMVAASGLMLTGCFLTDDEAARVFVEPPQPTAQELQDAANEVTAHSEFQQQWGLDQDGLRAQRAVGRLLATVGADVLPGQGIDIAVIDTGIDLGHWEFNRDRVRLVPVPGENLTDTSGTWYHGTSVASIIVAQRDDTPPPSLSSFNFHGVAWGANLTMYAIELGAADPSRPYTPVTLAGLAAGDAYWAFLFGLALEPSPDIANMSFGYSGLIEDYGAEDLRAALPTHIATIAQEGVVDKTVLVFSAGNGHGFPCTAGSAHCEGNDPNHSQNNLNATSPTVLGGLPVRIPELRGHVVAVAAYQSNGEIASFSNRCGIAAKWCLAAPGSGVWVARSSTDDGVIYSRGYGRGGGTSFAAPMVAGGLAIVKQWFRHQLTGPEVLARVYETARVVPDPVSSHGGICPSHLDLDGDLSQCELSSEFGRGKMDIDAATEPIGMVSFVPDGRIASAEPVPAAHSSVSISSPFGDGLGTALGDQEIALFDTMGAPFWVRGEEFVRPAEHSLSPAQVHQFTSSIARRRAAVFGFDSGGSLPWPAGSATFSRTPSVRVGITQGSAGSYRSHLDLAGSVPTVAVGTRRLSVAAVATAGDADSVTGMVASYRPRFDPQFTLGVGVIRESDALAGMRTAGAFGDSGASSAFVGITKIHRGELWDLEGGFELGWISPTVTSNLWHTHGSLHSSALRARASRQFGPRSRLTLSMSQPLRVERGRATFRVPVGRTLDGMVLHTNRRVDLEPTGRQLDVGAEWALQLQRGADLRAGLFVSRHPGHRSDRGTTATFLAGLHFDF